VYTYQALREIHEPLALFAVLRAGREEVEMKAKVTAAFQMASNASGKQNLALQGLRDAGTSQ
jgi:hypothetical protein